MYTSPILYKTSSAGKEQSWKIETQASNMKGWQVITTHGYIDGVQQISVFDVLEGKNIGKSNETTAEEQADLEAISKWKKQLDKGYSEERGGASKEYKPMLAHSYDDHKEKVTFPCYVQPKLDGMRCIAVRDCDEITLTSRGNKEIKYMEHIKAELLQYMEDGDAWDGELYSHELSFQDVMKYVKKSCPENKLVQFHVYDVISSEDFCTRFLNDKMVNLDVMEYASVDWVGTFKCDSHEQVIEYHNKFVENGYEGAIVRHGQCLYKNGGRSNQLLKVKAFFDAEYTIVDIIPAERQPTHAIFVCAVPSSDVTFSATPEGSFELKEQYLRDRDKLIGKMLTVRYFELTTSETPVPRFPIAVAVRDYE